MAWSLQSFVVLPVEAWALRTEPLGKKVLCLVVSALSPELLPSFSEHGSGEMGPWASLCLLSASFLNGPRSKKPGDASNATQESEKAINRVSTQVLLDIMTGPKC